MAKRDEVKSQKRKRDSTKKEEVVSVHRRVVDTVGAETLRGIGGVLLVIGALLLLLSALGMAGIAGERSYQFLKKVFGIGYYLLPLLLVVWAVSLFRTNPEERGAGPIRSFGALLFFLSSLSIVAVISDTAGGVVGALVAKPLASYLDMIASLVLLAGFWVISLLLIFDSSFWAMLWRRTCAVFVRAKSQGESVDADGLSVREDKEPVVQAWSPEPVAPTSLNTAPEPVSVATMSGEEERGPRDVSELDEFVEPVPSAKKPRHVEMPSEYTPPPLSILEPDKGKPNVGDSKARANIIQRTLGKFGIRVEMDEITVGPTVTRYALKPAEGVKLQKITSLQPNLEYALAASPIRIEAPIPGKSLVGIEVPNTGKATVGLAGLIASPEFQDEPAPLMITLGKDIAGSAHYANVGKMPHVLVAGTTGSGKSVMIHAIISSLLYKNGPERLRLILVDPKRVELTLYDNIPHLMTPVITEAKRCILALKWAAKEMDRRYDVLRAHKVQDVGTYQADVVAPALVQFEKHKSKGKDPDDFELPDLMPHIVIVIDELADIMTAYPKELEASIVRLAQMSRAVGIHLVLSTQRPSANVITGLIKANIPTRIALKVSSLLESRIILDQPGAEKLLGAGDMLYLSSDMAKPRRIQSPFITTSEVKKIAAFLTKNNEYVLGDQISLGEAPSESGQGGASSSMGGIPIDDMAADDETDEIYEEARRVVIEAGKASTSYLQRKLSIGYGRAAKLMDALEARGVIGPQNGSKPREVLAGTSKATTDTDGTSGYED